MATHTTSGRPSSLDERDLRLHLVVFWGPRQQTKAQIALSFGDPMGGGGQSGQPSSLCVSVGFLDLQMCPIPQRPNDPNIDDMPFLHAHQLVALRQHQEVQHGPQTRSTLLSLPKADSESQYSHAAARAHTVSALRWGPGKMLWCGVK